MGAAGPHPGDCAPLADPILAGRWILRRPARVPTAGARRSFTTPAAPRAVSPTPAPDRTEAPAGNRDPEFQSGPFFGGLPNVCVTRGRNADRLCRAGWWIKRRQHRDHQEPRGPPVGLGQRAGPRPGRRHRQGFRQNHRRAQRRHGLDQFRRLLPAGGVAPGRGLFRTASGGGCGLWSSHRGGRGIA